MSCPVPGTDGYAGMQTFDAPLTKKSPRDAGAVTCCSSEYNPDISDV